MRLDSIMKELAIQAQQGSAPRDDSKDGWDAAQYYFEHSSGQRIDTDAYMTSVLRKEFPGMSITGTVSGPSLLAFADATAEAEYSPILDGDVHSAPYSKKLYVPPARRIDGPGVGELRDVVRFGKFAYSYKGQHYILFVCSGRDGGSAFPTILSQFVLHAQTDNAQAGVNDLLRSAGKWSVALHDEIWVFNQGFWSKDAQLFASIMKAEWKDVILDESSKAAIQADVRRFFDSRDRYDKLRVPWKRGVIYHGPPGNGKTISIKATMHELYRREVPVPTLYVRSLTSFAGPEQSVKMIFAKARAEAPCLLVFEDLDSLITDQVRSYFLNEVDGLQTNEGVMMIGSTNHLDRLDPGISKRPSRFDRKFLFPKPNLEQRAMYCDYWRGKLKDNKDIKFPKEMCTEIAKITDDFSFAYLQEAFVAALLAIAFSEEDEETRAAKDVEIGSLIGLTGTTRRKMEAQLAKTEANAHSDGAKKVECETCMNSHNKLDDLILWREIKRQVEILREEM